MASSLSRGQRHQGQIVIRYIVLLVSLQRLMEVLPSWQTKSPEDGTYYFIVVAHNDNGDTLSNCVEITVDKPIVPGYDVYLLTSLIFVVSVILIKNWKKKKYN